MTNDHIIINKMLMPLRKSIVAGHPLVLISEEYGYRNWFWFPRKSKKEVIKWWKRQKNPKSFGWPVHCTQIGELVLAKYGQYYTLEHNLYLDLYTNLKAMRLDSIWFAHVFNDEDTYLLASKNREIHPASYYPTIIRNENFLLTPERTNIELNFYDEREHL